MANGFQISKNVVAGVLAVIILAAGGLYLLSAASAQGSTCNAGDAVSCGLPIGAQVNGGAEWQVTDTAASGTPIANAPVRIGGCGCGGGIDNAAANIVAAPAPANVQDIYIRALNTGSYDKQEITVKKGIPVRLHFTADPDAGCGRQIVLYGLNAKAISKNGEEGIADFTPQDAGTYEYNCGMRMWQPGKLIVTE